MTPEQQNALESVAERSLTQDEITVIDRFLPDRQDIQIAEVLSVGRIKLVKHTIGKGDVLDTIGFESGNALLDAVEANTLFRHVKPELDRGDLDISRPIVRGALDNMAGVVSGFTQVHANALKALAEVPDPIHFNKVSDALNIAEGRLTLGAL